MNDIPSLRNVLISGFIPWMWGCHAFHLTLLCFKAIPPIEMMSGVLAALMGFWFACGATTPFVGYTLRWSVIWYAYAKPLLVTLLLLYIVLTLASTSGVDFRKWGEFTTSARPHTGEAPLLSRGANLLVQAVTGLMLFVGRTLLVMYSSLPFAIVPLGLITGLLRVWRARSPREQQSSYDQSGSQEERYRRWLQEQAEREDHQ